MGAATGCAACRRAVGVAGGLCSGCAAAASGLIAVLAGGATAEGPWFHVSPSRFEPGTLLLPGIATNPANADFYRHGFGADTGVLVDMGVRRDQVVWLSAGFDDARYWSHVLAAPLCYEVEPVGQPRPWNGTGTDGWITRAAIVLREIG